MPQIIIHRSNGTCIRRIHKIYWKHSIASIMSLTNIHISRSTRGCLMHYELFNYFQLNYILTEFYRKHTKLCKARSFSIYSLTIADTITLFNHFSTHLSHLIANYNTSPLRPPVSAWRYLITVPDTLFCLLTNCKIFF